MVVPEAANIPPTRWQTEIRASGVNAGEKMHRRVGVKMHYGRMGGRPRMRGTGSSSVTAKSALQFDQ
jgi:hypothetical protein